MIREIKFRAWDKIHKEFTNAPYSTMGLKSRYEWQQYTGLKDNSEDKVEIYEGDILVSSIDGNKRVVEWCIEEASFKARHLPQCEYIDPLYLCDGEFTVIGNVHE